jgi:hypothetical protein
LKSRIFSSRRADGCIEKMYFDGPVPPSARPVMTPNRL